MARPVCLYCGAALPAEVVAAAAESASLVTAPSAPPTPPGAWAGTLVVVDQSSGDAATLGDALGLVPYEAALRHRRGGYSLQGVFDPALAEAEAARLRAAGLAVFLVPESVARAEPLVAHAGVREKEGLRLLGASGPWEIAASHLLLVVRGPIVREYQAPLEQRRIRTARLEDGYRFHLHRRSSPLPLELDPGDFDFGAQAPLSGSSILEMSAWIESVAQGTPVDDAFRHSTPALGPTTARPSGPTAAAAALSGTDPGKRDHRGGAVHDNLRQFRFYSCWRGAVERARREHP
jgi:hypothetical protein